jgi:hypothetical protein
MSEPPPRKRIKLSRKLPVPIPSKLVALPNSLIGLVAGFLPLTSVLALLRCKKTWPMEAWLGSFRTAGWRDGLTQCWNDEHVCDKFMLLGVAWSRKPVKFIAYTEDDDLTEGETPGPIHPVDMPFRFQQYEANLAYNMARVWCPTEVDNIKSLAASKTVAYARCNDAHFLSRHALKDCADLARSFDSLLLITACDQCTESLGWLLDCGIKPTQEMLCKALIFALIKPAPANQENKTFELVRSKLAAIYPPPSSSSSSSSSSSAAAAYLETTSTMLPRVAAIAALSGHTKITMEILTDNARQFTEYELVRVARFHMASKAAVNTAILRHVLDSVDSKAQTSVWTALVEACCDMGNVAALTYLLGRLSIDRDALYYGVKITDRAPKGVIIRSADTDDIKENSSDRAIMLNQCYVTARHLIERERSYSYFAFEPDELDDDGFDQYRASHQFSMGQRIGMVLALLGKLPKNLLTESLSTQLVGACFNYDLVVAILTHIQGLPLPEPPTVLFERLLNYNLDWHMSDSTDSMALLRRVLAVKGYETDLENQCVAVCNADANFCKRIAPQAMLLIVQRCASRLYLDAVLHKFISETRHCASALHLLQFNAGLPTAKQQSIVAHIATDCIDDLRNKIIHGVEPSSSRAANDRFTKKFGMPMLKLLCSAEIAGGQLGNVLTNRNPTFDLQSQHLDMEIMISKTVEREQKRQLSQTQSDLKRLRAMKISTSTTTTTTTAKSTTKTTPAVNKQQKTPKPSSSSSASSSSSSATAPAKKLKIKFIDLSD